MCARQGKVQSPRTTVNTPRTLAAALSIAAALCALAIWLLGGFTAGAIAANDPLRPLIVSLASALAYLALTGFERARGDFRQHGARFITPLAIVLALSPAVAGVARNTWTAGGADAYAYVSQADRWLQFRLKTAVPIASFAPWPDPIWTFTPHGYRPSVDGASLVPVTAPGLPLMMAATKFIAGHCAMFWIPPLSGALLVWMTFAIGRRLGSPAIGLAAAWLLATSPAFLAMLVSPMSDVPASAFWAVALFFALPRSSTPAHVMGSVRTAGLSQRVGARPALRTAYCGLAASAAILIRPNLAPLAIVIASWSWLQSPGSWSRAFSILATVLPTCLFIAWLNNHLYGSPFSSGYGGVATLFSAGNMATNLQRYGGWLVESQTLLAVLGLMALALPMRAIWPTREWQRAALLMALMVALVWMLYLIYTPFDAWWYLRFLLPAWPAMCLGSAALLVRFISARNPVVTMLAFAVLCAVGIHGIYFAASHGAFPSGEGDHRYVSIAKLAAEVTEPSSVIITGQNTGPTRYYGGRVTLRFDLLDEAWLDRAVKWLSEHGHHPYILVEEWELPLFQQRFASRNTLGALGFAPMMAYHAPGVPGSVYLFDPLRQTGPTLRPAPPLSAHSKCVGPAAEPLLN